MLMMDTKGTLFPTALKLAVEYASDQSNPPLRKECSVNEVAHLTATYYLKIGKKGLAVECVELFTEIKDKISFLKRAGFIDEAVDMLYKMKQYDNLYRLLKGQGLFEKGASISSKLHDHDSYCMFLLLIIKAKLYAAQSANNSTSFYGTQSRAEDAAELQRACKQVKDGDIKLQGDLICAILKEDINSCFAVSKNYTYLNPFGSAEALNASVSIYLKKAPLSFTNQQIGSILTSLRVILETYDALRDTNGVPQQVVLQCLKFYDFERSDETLFLPPQQFFWIPELSTSASTQTDSDGLLQLKVPDVFGTVQKHIVGLACKCLKLKLEDYLFDQINSEKYALLNVALTKPEKDFAVACSTVSDLSVYLRCCAQLIEMGHYHSKFDSFQPVEDGNFSCTNHIIHYGSSRLVNAFSPQWNFYLPLIKKDVKMIQYSKVVCNQLNKSINQIIEKKKYHPAWDINSFLYKWHFLKITGSNTSELEKPLIEEGASVNDNVKQNSRFLPPPVFIKENINLSNAKYFHSFLIWSSTCKGLTSSGKFMSFAEGVVKRLLLLVAKNRYIQAKISALNAVSMLEIISVGLLGVLQASGAHVGYGDITVIIPQLYEHAVQFFDDLNVSEKSKNMWMLTAVVQTVAKTPAKKLEKLYMDSLRLLQRIVCILVGLEVPSFNILTYALGRSIYNNGFERCFVLCLCLLGNLAPLIVNKDLQAIHSSVCSLAMNLQHLQSTLQDQPHLLNAIKHTAMATDVKEVFCVVRDIQQRYSSHVVNMRYGYGIKPFVFTRIESRFFPQHGLQPLPMLVQQFATTAQQPTIAPIGSHISANNSKNDLQTHNVPNFTMGFPTIDSPSLPMRPKASSGQSTTVGVKGLNIDLGTSIDPNSDITSLVFSSEESPSPLYMSPYHASVPVEPISAPHSTYTSPFSASGPHSALDEAITEGLQQPNQFGDLQSLSLEYVTPQQHFDMLNSLIAAGMTPEQLQYQLAWTQQNYYQNTEAPLLDSATSQYSPSLSVIGQPPGGAAVQPGQFMQPGDTNNLYEEFEQTDYYSEAPGTIEPVNSPSAINAPSANFSGGEVGGKWYCKVCGVYLRQEAEPEEDYNLEQDAYHVHCSTNTHVEKMQDYMRYQEVLKWCYNDVMEEAKRIVNNRKKAPQVITLQAKIDNISDIRSKLGRAHTSTESSNSWADGMKRVEMIANELMKLVDDYHHHLKAIPKQPVFAAAKHDVFVMSDDDEDYLDVDVPDAKSQREKRHKQY